MTDILSAIAAENGIIESTDTPNTDTSKTDTSKTDTTAQAATDAASEDKKTFSDLNIAKPILHQEFLRIWYLWE